MKFVGDDMIDISHFIEFQDYPWKKLQVQQYFFISQIFLLRMFIVHTYFVPKMFSNFQDG